MKSFLIKSVCCLKVALVLITVCILFGGCRPSARYIRDLEDGKYPTGANYPNTRWSCRELDLVIDMIEGYGMEMFGTYTVNGTAYRMVAARAKGNPGLDFCFYSSHEETPTGSDARPIHCEPIEAGYLYTTYEYQKASGILMCKVLHSEPVDGETVPETLTFTQTGTFAKTAEMRWVSEEPEIFLDSYSDIDGFFKGEITVDGETYRIKAVEIGGGHYYQLNTTKGQRTYMSFAISDDQIVATRTDTGGEIAWDPNITTITFHPAPVE